MPEMLRDGAGSGSLAKINANQRLYTNAISVPEDQQATKLGNSYNINTGDITLTNATETPVLYVKNNETQDLHITAIAVGFGTSDGTATEVVKISVERNPTAGTTIDNANAVAINGNRNYGSAKTLSVNAYKGATGETLTGGTDLLYFYQPDFGRLFAVIDEIIPKGNSIGIKITPPSSNTSLQLYAALVCHLEDANE